MDLVTLVKQWKAACVALLENETGYTRDAFDCVDSDLVHYLQDNCGKNSEKMHHDITALVEAEVSILRNEGEIMVRVYKRRATLSDDSVVYDVIIEDKHGQQIELNCHSELQADSLVDNLRLNLNNFGVLHQPRLGR